VTDIVDPVERLAEAARNAVLARWGAIEAGGPGALRSIVLEIEPANRGERLTVEMYLNWRQSIRRAG
jgi:hypothetical protein